VQPRVDEREIGMKTRSFALACLAVLAPVLGAAAKAPETYGIANATFPERGVMAAGQPTGEQIQLLAEDGYKTLIDLRAPEEPHGFDEPEAARENGLTYVNIPVNPATLDQATLDRFLKAMERAERPLLLHCGTSNRAAGLLYAWLVLERGVAPQDALKRAKAAGLRQPEMIERVTKLVGERRGQPLQSHRPGSPEGNPRRPGPSPPQPSSPTSRPPFRERRGPATDLLLKTPSLPAGGCEVGERGKGE